MRDVRAERAHLHTGYCLLDTGYFIVKCVQYFLQQFCISPRMRGIQSYRIAVLFIFHHGDTGTESRSRRSEIRDQLEKSGRSKIRNRNGC